LLFWRPWILEKEWPYIFTLKLDEGKLIANTELGKAIQKINLDKVCVTITGLEILNKKFFYGFV
jgi:hypothetical protein